MAGSTTTTRGISRSPPFVVVCLILSLLVLAFYYWRLSTQNSDLAFLLDEQKNIVRAEFSKRSNNEQRMSTLMNNLKECQTLVEQDKSIIVEKEDNLKSLTNQVQSKTDEVVEKQKLVDQCEGNLKKCQDDSNGIKQELDKLKEESSKKDDELKKLREGAAGAQCNCDQALLDQRRSIENLLEKTVGDQPIQALRANGFGQLPDSNQPAAKAQKAPPSDGGEKIETKIPELKAEKDTTKDNRVVDNGGHAAEVKEANVENKEPEKNADNRNSEVKEDKENVENHGGEADNEDNDVVGKKVIDEANGNDDETLKFRKGDESERNIDGN